MSIVPYEPVSTYEALRLITGDDPDRFLYSWPWMQVRGVLPHRLRPPPTPPDPHHFVNIQFDDLEDEEIDSSYCPSETSLEEYASDSSSDVSESAFALTDEELKELRTDHTGRQSEDERADQSMKYEIMELENLEELAPKLYNPDEVVSLVTEFYTLMIDMGHWDHSILHHGPHTDPGIDIQLATGLGYNQHVIDLMEKLPYLDKAAQRNKRIFSDTDFLDYRNEQDLRNGRCPAFTDVPVESHVLPLVRPGNWHGRMMLLDTKLGVIRAYNIDGPPTTIEWLRVGNDPSELPVPDRPFDYYLAPCILAAEFLGNLIECYRSLDRVPIISMYGSDPNGVLRQAADHAYDDEGKMSARIKSLYLECGWPDEWQRDEFLKRLQVFENDIPRSY
ncbi:hypothetical protein B0J14DRAFT_599162 [Halenospora varia]|nr:hypothetical protein B0J14DRAFT_599162 [Halenospora varia]